MILPWAQRLGLTAVFVLFGLPLFAQLSSTTIDFSRQTVTVWGLGGCPWESSVSYEEERARAWMDALHHAYEAIAELPLMEGVNVSQAIVRNPTLRDRLGRLLLGTKKTWFEPDGSGMIRCRLEVPFCGKESLRSTLYLAALRPGSFDSKTIPTASESKTASEAGSDTATIAGEVVATGTGPLRVVLDVRRFPFEASLFPRFLAEDGSLLFQEAQIPPPERFRRPVVRFTEQVTESTSGLDIGRVEYLETIVPILAHRDLVILEADAMVFKRFCRRLLKEPLGSREILIVYGNQILPTGSLPKVVKKDKESGSAVKTTTKSSSSARRGKSRGSAK